MVAHYCSLLSLLFCDKNLKECLYYVAMFVYTFVHCCVVCVQYCIYQPIVTKLRTFFDLYSWCTIMHIIIIIIMRSLNS